MAELVRLARAEKWPGYFGAPHLANASLGERSWRQFASLAIDASLRFLEGREPEGPLYTDVMARDAATAAVDRGTRQRDRAITERQRRWARRNGVPF